MTATGATEKGRPATTEVLAAGGANGKAEQVRSMFSEIAPTYDLLNTVLSFGIDARWRAQAAQEALPAVMPAAAEGADAGFDRAVLDVATGTGNLAIALKRRCAACRVVGVDFAEPMLARAREKADRAGVDATFAVADGSSLPYDDGTFDAVTIAYGLRNFADPDRGLREFRRVLKPGGRLVVLEFPPPPKGAFGAIFRWYFTAFLPRLGGWVSGKRSAYAYLPASVLAFFPPEDLAGRMQLAGFDDVRYRLQTFGVSALHVGVAGSGRVA